MAQQFGLGRGLSSLIPDAPSASDGKARAVGSRRDRDSRSGAPLPVRGNVGDGQNILQVETGSVRPNPHQPRSRFSDEKLEELAYSIREHGILQPLVVTEILGDGAHKYELIAGERRLRAAKIAGLEKIPVIVRSANDIQKLELAIIENIQRHDLGSIEEARAYEKLAEEFGCSQEQIAKKMGKSRSSVANSIRLLQLPLDIQKGITEGEITEGHAKAILAMENPEKMRALYNEIIKNNLTVRETEQKVAEYTPVKSHTRVSSRQDPQLKAVEDEMHELLGTKVKVARQGKGAKITISCFSRDELIRLVDRLR